MNFKNIFLVGFRAVGKSTVAPIFAQKLGYELVEMDTMIQEKTGQSVAELTQNGTNWTKFRNIETEILTQLVKGQGRIVSCGGGCGVNDLTGKAQKKLLNSSDENLVVLLLANEQTIATRLRQNYEKLENQDQNHRQSLDGSQNDDINEKVAKDMEIYRLRLPLYRDLTKFYINSDQDIDLVVGEIMGLL